MKHDCKKNKDWEGIPYEIIFNGFDWRIECGSSYHMVGPIKFCPFCGEDLTKGTCPVCVKNDSDEICEECKKKYNTDYKTIMKKIKDFL